MTKTLLLLLIGIFVYSCASSEMRNTKIRYFDENDVEIKKSKFNRILSTNKLLDIPGDSVNHRKLILREKHGRITNRPMLQSMLEKEINQNLDSSKPLVIIYYPGKDSCNSSGIATREMRKTWFEQLEDGVYKISQTRPIYIYKDEDGLENFGGGLRWHKDPEGIIEKLFFQYHYPCDSFVVISEEGNYISYFGEFGMRYVLEATELMNK